MIAIIGKSGVGKTTILNILEAKGFRTFNADIYVKNLYKKGGLGYKKMQEKWGNLYINNEGVDKNALRARLIEDPNFINEVEKLIYPLIEEHLKFNYYDFAEVPNLYSPNGNFVGLFDKIVRIEMDEKYRQKNLQKRNVNKSQKAVIDTLNKGFFEKNVVNIKCKKVTTKRFFDNLMEIYFAAF
ncbi:dephospho-CoA kinase [Mycoplasma sp. 128]|uniref:dephospho-CoA kinase n=1 Tax=Mycoplasma sp. 3341 TaxID=3447506 RepID=UPI003F655652